MNHKQIIDKDYRVQQMYLKNNLVMMTSDDLIDACQTPDYCQFFLHNLLLLIEEEPGFLLSGEEMEDSFDNVLAKADKVVNSVRFQYQKDSLYEMFNDAIIQLNMLKSMSDFQRLSRQLHYLSYQEDCRCKKFYSTSELLRANANDIFVYKTFQDGHPYLPHDELVSGLYYFSYCYPEMFQSEDFYQNSQAFLLGQEQVPFYKKRGPVYQLAQKTKYMIEGIHKN